jgi:hypothetical protein
MSGTNLDEIESNSSERTEFVSVLSPVDVVTSSLSTDTSSSSSLLESILGISFGQKFQP